MKGFFDKFNPSPQLTGFALHCGYWAKYQVTSRRPNFSLNGPKEHDIGVFYVHGTADMPLAFMQVKTLINNELKALGSDDVDHHFCVFHNRFAGTSIEEYAEQLAKIINEAEYKQVVLVGHSRGGLIIAHYAAFLAAKHDVNVLQLHAIASPFQGADAAYLAHYLGPGYLVSEDKSSSIAQMKCCSRFLTDLNAELCKRLAAGTLDAYFYATRWDGLVNFHDVYPSPLRGLSETDFPERVWVYPDKLSWVSGATQNHLSIMRSSKLSENIANKLASRLSSVKDRLEPPVVTGHGLVNSVRHK